MVTLSLPALGMFVSGLGCLGLFRYTWPKRDRPGGRMWLGVVACMGLWAFSYGAALTVFDPALRVLFEVPIWFSFAWIGVFYLAFGLEYTGRAELVRGPWFAAVVGFETVVSLLVVTNGWHGLVWSSYRLDPVFGAATVTYTHQSLLFVQAVVSVACTWAGMFFLVDTISSYGRLYRAQATAIALSPVPVAIAFGIWAFELGPVPQLNFTPLMFVPHLMLDTYALFWNDMFELTPATRRIGERTAIDDLGSAVVIVDDDFRVITLNPAAERLFDVDKRTVLTSQLSALVGESIDPTQDEQYLAIQTQGERREFKTSHSPVEDAAGTLVGYTVVFQDVTAEIQRKQRLSVLNRVLRHNLRNDLTVVGFYADDLADYVDDPEKAEEARRIRETTDGLVGLSEKVRDIEQVLDAEGTEREVVLRDLLSMVGEDLRGRFTDGTVVLDVPDDLVVRTRGSIVELVCKTLVENGLEHNDADDPRVEITVADERPDPHSVTVRIRDNGPGIPDHEVAVLDSAEETALEHGSGLGLWLVHWGVTTLGGELSFETPEDGGTVASIRLPGVVDGEAETTDAVAEVADADD